MRQLACMQIILGRNNPLAKAAALGNLAEEQGPLHAAAAHDLDVLQKLAVAETTLAGMLLQSVAGFRHAHCRQ